MADGVGPEDIRAQAEDYWRTAALCGRGHYIAAETAESKNKYLGIPTTVLGALVGTAIFTTIKSTPALGWKIVAGLTSLTTSILATLQTFFKYSSVAANHRGAGAAYGSLRRQFDAFMLLLPTSDRAILLAHLDRLRHEIDRLGKDTPLIPPRAYSMAVKESQSRIELLRTTHSSRDNDAEG